MTDVTDLANAQAEARRRVAAIPAGQWDLPTPCSDWSLRDLLVHLIEGSAMTVSLLDGATAEAALAVFGVAHGPDLAAELDAALMAELAAFEGPGAFDTIVHHPGPGDIPGAVLYQFRTADYLLHSWDIARAVGADEDLPDDLVSGVWEAMQPMVPVIGTIGVFGTGPSGDVAEDAPLQVRLLDVSGRRP
jgi:uncharacterized protein (TIGR03086 family)